MARELVVTPLDRVPRDEQPSHQRANSMFGHRRARHASREYCRQDRACADCDRIGWSGRDRWSDLRGGNVSHSRSRWGSGRGNGLAVGRGGLSRTLGVSAGGYFPGISGPCRVSRSPLSSPESVEREGTRLVKCLACGRQISSEAEACPQCGHPNKTASPASVGPRCYACPAQATTLCQSCGAMSCVTHLKSVFVHHGPDHGGGYELRCESCHSSYMTWRIVAGIIAGFVFILLVLTMGRR